MPYLKEFTTYQRKKLREIVRTGGCYGGKALKEWLKLVTELPIEMGCQHFREDKPFISVEDKYLPVLIYRCEKLLSRVHVHPERYKQALLISLEERR